MVATFALTSMIISLAACSFDLVPLVPCFRNLDFVEDIDVVEASEAVKVGEVAVDKHDMSSSFHSQAPGKAFVFDQITCPMPPRQPFLAGACEKFFQRCR